MREKKHSVTSWQFIVLRRTERVPTSRRYWLGFQLPEGKIFIASDWIIRKDWYWIIQRPDLSPSLLNLAGDICTRLDVPEDILLCRVNRTPPHPTRPTNLLPILYVLTDTINMTRSEHYLNWRRQI